MDRTSGAVADDFQGRKTGASLRGAANPALPLGNFVRARLGRPRGGLEEYIVNSTG